MAVLELVNEDQTALRLTEIYLAVSKCRDEKACIP